MTRTNFLFTVVTLAALLSLQGCATVTPPKDARLTAAERLVDAFYSFDPVRLETAMTGAEESIPRIAYYQGWAEGGHYRVVERRPCVIANEREVSCSIKVEDDLIKALGLSMHVTDTFHVTFDREKMVKVTTSSNDPPLFEEAMQWVRRERAASLEQPCRDFFKGGPTPGECVQMIVRGFREFAEMKKAGAPATR